MPSHDAAAGADARPGVVHGPDGWRVVGSDCPNCGYRTVHARPRCPRCRATLTPVQFAPTGTVWSSTVVRVPVPGRTPPYVLAYVDLTDGPRLLAHLTGAGDAAPAIGTPVTVCGVGDDGDVEVRPA